MNHQMIQVMHRRLELSFQWKIPTEHPCVELLLSRLDRKGDIFIFTWETSEL